MKIIKIIIGVILYTIGLSYIVAIVVFAILS